MATYTGTSGPDTETGTSGNDTFNMGQGGNDICYGKAGDDTFNFGAAFTAKDTINGGSGNDTLTLNGDYAIPTDFKGTTLKSVENIVLAAGHVYSFNSADGNVAAGATLKVDGSALGPSDALNWNGSKETNGHFHLLGGRGGDFLEGGNLSDVIVGGRGEDFLQGNGGSDTFKFYSKFGKDTIYDFTASGSDHDIMHFNANFANYAAVKAHMANDGSGNVIITLDSGDTITVDNVTKAHLVAADFTFG